jgi:hypothetical protein
MLAREPCCGWQVRMALVPGNEVSSTHRLALHGRMLIDIVATAIYQNDGTLSRRAREREFAELTDDEVARIEATYAKAFSG